MCFFFQVMLAILIGLLTVLTWHFTKVYTTKSLNTLAFGLRYELLQRPILRMWNILNSTSEITTAQVKLSEYVIRRYSKPTNQAEQVEVHPYKTSMVKFYRSSSYYTFSLCKFSPSVIVFTSPNVVFGPEINFFFVSLTYGQLQILVLSFGEGEGS